MATTKFHPYFEERVDFEFGVRGSAVRACLRDGIRGAQEFSLARPRPLLDASKAAPNASFTFAGNLILVRGSRLLVQTSGTGRIHDLRAMEVAARIVAALGAQKLTKFVYQERAVDEIEPKRFRASLERVRKLIGPSVGPAVVSGSHAYFYPQAAKKPAENLSLQLLMEGFDPKIERLLRAVNLQPAAALSQILESLRLASASEWRALAAGSSEDTLIGTESRTLRQFRVSLRMPTLISYVADMKAGELREFQTEYARVVDLLALLAPRRHRLEAFHPATGLPLQDAQGWEPHALGLDVIRSVFVAEDLRYDQQGLFNRARSG